MKWVLRDYLRRWWWVIALTILGQMALMEPSTKAQRMAPLLSLFVGVIPILMDLSRGFMRTISLLPIRRREIATKFWLMSVAIPAGITIGISLVGPAGFAYFQQKIFLNPGLVAVHGLTAFLFCGTMFAAFAGRPAPTPGKAAAINAGCYILAVLFSIGGLLYLIMSNPWRGVDSSGNSWAGIDWKEGLLAGFALLTTWYGWCSRENLVRQNSQPTAAHLAALQPLLPRVEKRAPKGRGGWIFLLQNTARAYAIITVLMVILMGVCSFAFSFLDTATLFRNTTHAEGFQGNDNPFTLGIWLCTIGFSLLPALQPRLLRMLPIRPGIVAGLTVGLPLLISFITMWVLYCVAWIATDDPQPAWNRATRMAVFFVVAGPVILRWGTSRVTVIAMAVLFLLLLGITSNSRSVFVTGFCSWALIAAVPLCYCFTYRLLTRSSVPYRRQLFRLPGIPTGG
jgi:hypothetical protein